MAVAIVALAVCCSSANAILVSSDTFTYPNGPLVGNGGWVTHSGTTPNQVDVSGGMVNITQAETEDVNKPFAAFTTGTLYAGLSFNFSTLPTGTGGYFFH